MQVYDFFYSLQKPDVQPLIKAAVAQAYLPVVRPFPEGNAGGHSGAGCEDVCHPGGEFSKAERDQAECDPAGPSEVWNEQAWCLLVAQVTVHADGSAEFLFRGENRIMIV